MGEAHDDVGSLSRKRYTQYVGQQPKKGTPGQLREQRTPEGTHTDEGKEGSAHARTERLEDRHNWRS
jgi:hypothetical protein